MFKLGVMPIRRPSGEVEHAGEWMSLRVSGKVTIGGVTVGVKSLDKIIKGVSVEREKRSEDCPGWCGSVGWSIIP